MRKLKPELKSLKFQYPDALTICIKDGKKNVFKNTGYVTVTSHSCERDRRKKIN